MRSLWLLVVALTACAGPDATPATGGTRIVALLPAATEIIDALGQGDALVGRAEEDSARSLVHLPSAGRVLSPSAERVVALRPDVVIAWPGADPLLQHMRSLGVRTLAARFERVDDVASNTRSIGRLLGVPHKADSLALHITVELERLRRLNHGDGRPSVLYLLDTGPFWTTGSNTFVDDLIRIAGGINVFADLPTPWAEVSMEAIISRQPDIIIVARPAARVGAREWLRHAGWRGLRAVQGNRVYFVEADRFNRPGPNVVETARQLAALLHPGSQE